MEIKIPLEPDVPLRLDFVVTIHLPGKDPFAAVVVSEHEDHVRVVRLPLAQAAGRMPNP